MSRRDQEQGSKGHSADPHPVPTTHDEALAQIWRLLGRGVADRRHGFRLPTLSTVDEQGLPRARTVVLRRAIPDAGVIACHTDARSPKVRELVHQPAVAWTFYDAGERVQVRATGKAEVLRPDEDSRAEEAWQRTSLDSRRCYLAPHAPSSTSPGSSSNLPSAFEERKPTQAESEAGRAHFRVVWTVIERLEWLTLRHDGHRRAHFELDAGHVTSAAWIHP